MDELVMAITHSFNPAKWGAFSTKNDYSIPATRNDSPTPYFVFGGEVVSAPVEVENGYVFEVLVPNTYSVVGQTELYEGVPSLVQVLSEERVEKRTQVHVRGRYVPGFGIHALGIGTEI